ncbi:hypothetical protein, partial [Komagataeibacter rhaeticus]|uniref:hypothetical protein n=1 Tax=Komagataeibacter rhaeticus TaxID=215221 RepID=UPI002493C52D
MARHIAATSVSVIGTRWRYGPLARAHRRRAAVGPPAHGRGGMRSGYVCDACFHRSGGRHPAPHR